MTNWIGDKMITVTVWYLKRKRRNNMSPVIKTIIERLIRSGIAIALPQIIMFVPAVMEMIPPPYNLILTPVLMGIAKGLRDGFPNAPWLKYIPF